jgi:hypothetical protein
VSDHTVSPTPGVRRTRRQRRPTGAPPPLPRRITPSTAVWLVLTAIIVTATFLVSANTPWLRIGDHAGTWLLRQLASVRTPWLTDLANWTSDTVLTWHPVIAVAVVLLIIVFRRWRHLLVFTLCLFLLEIAGSWIYNALSRPRPYGVPDRMDEVSLSAQPGRAADTCGRCRGGLGGLAWTAGASWVLGGRLAGCAVS